MQAQPTLPTGRFTIETLDGEKFIGRSADAIIDAMRSNSWGESGETREQYRVALAERLRLWKKQPVRHETSDLLLLDMLDMGIVRIL